MLFQNMSTGNASTCRHITQVSDFRDKRWATNNCTVTFNTVGIWPENADGGNINCCDCSLDLELLVAGDDLGKVKIYNYPVSQPKVSGNVIQCDKWM